MAYFTPAELPGNKYYIFGQGGGQELAEQYDVPLLGQIPLVQGIREAGDFGQAGRDERRRNGPGLQGPGPGAGPARIHPQRGGRQDESSSNESITWLLVISYWLPVVHNLIT
jgi:hypothetical protein